MKRFLALSTVLAATLGLISCEKHSWDEETKRLYPSHDHADHAAHGDKKGDAKQHEGEQKHEDLDHGSHSH